MCFSVNAVLYIFKQDKNNHNVLGFFFAVVFMNKNTRKITILVCGVVCSFKKNKQVIMNFF